MFEEPGYCAHCQQNVTAQLILEKKKIQKDTTIAMPLIAAV
jgi:hypothetical protein